MDCENCKNRIVLPAFSNGDCEICCIQIVCTNTPVDKICENCSKKHNLCQHCGKSLEE